MKTTFTITFLLSLLINISLSAQQYCTQIIPGGFSACENELGAGGLRILNGFCAEEQVILRMAPQEISPAIMCGNPGALLNIPSYYAFEADGSSEFSITISVINGSCSPESTSNGIQGTLVSLGDCLTQQPISNCQSQCSLTPFTLTTFHTPEPGEIIVLVLDGCTDVVCDVEFTINSGWTNVPMEPQIDPEVIQQSVLAPIGETVCKDLTFSVEPAFQGLCQYLWTLPDSTTKVTYTNTLHISILELTDGLICVQGYSACFEDQLYPSDLSICYEFVNEGFEEISISSEVTPADCHLMNGSISLDVEGGAGEFRYTWIPEVSDTNFAQNVPSGDYQVIISDAISPFCIYEAISISVGTTNKLQVEIVEIIDATSEDNDGSITIFINGPDIPYRYFLNSNEGSFDQAINTISDLAAGEYHLVLFEEFGFCNQAISFTIDKPTSTNRNSSSSSALQLFPNPTMDIVTLNKKFIGESYVIYNLAGQIIKSDLLKETSISLADLNAGVYLIKIMTVQGRNYIGKIVRM